MTVNRSKDDICLRCPFFPSSGLFVGVPVADPGAGDVARLAVLCCLLPTKLKFLNRASVLWFDVSDRALSAGDGGVSGICDGDGELPECGRRCASGGRFASACVAPRLFSPSLACCAGSAAPDVDVGGWSFAGW